MTNRTPLAALDAAVFLPVRRPGLAVSLALLTYDPADLPGRVYPVNAAPKNLLGRTGALLARSLHDSLGISVYLLLGVWLATVMLLLLRRRWLRWGLRLTGWLVLMPAIAVAATRWGS